MKTDELRAELHRLADEIEPFAADALGLHRRNRLHQALVAAAAVLALILTVSGVVVLANRGGQGVLVATSKLAPATGSLRVDVVVVPDDEEVQRILETSPSVRAYARIPRQQPAQKGSSTFASPFEPAACALKESAGFAVEAADGTHSLADDLRHQLSRDTQVFDIGHGNYDDAEVFMRADATSAHTSNIAAALAHDRAVASTKFLDHQAAYEEFARLFADHPDLVAEAKPENLPESFRLTLVDPSEGSALAARYETRADVSDVIVRRMKVANLGQIGIVGVSPTKCTTP